MNMELQQINPLTYVDHTSAIQADAPINQAKAYFRVENTGFAALLDQDTVLGLISRDTVLASQANTLHARDCISSHTLIVSIKDSIESLISRSLKRPQSHLGDDIILVDESSKFLGLISQGSFIRIQSAYYGQQIDLLHSASSAKDRKIDNLEGDLKLANRQLSENKEMVRRMKAMRSDFMSKFSQEAQAPIASIQTMLNLLEKSARNAEEHQLIDSANVSTHALLRLISCTLDYTKIDTNNLKLTEIRFSPIEVIEQCINAYREAAIEKDLILQLDHQGISPKLFGDAQLFTQIIDTLIDRSIDQTSAGGIRITVSQHAMREKAILHVEIRDSGMGWSLAEAQDLFEPQHNTDDDTHIFDIGTLVSERVANKMGGRLKYICEGNSGSLITLDLPFKMRATLPEAEETTQAEKIPIVKGQPHNSQPQVLIVDRNSGHSLAIKRLLMKLKCKVHSVANETAALKRLKEQPIDCIFIDCKATQLSAVDTTKRIRSGECGKHNKHVFITAMTESLSDNTRKICMAEGMNYVIANPVSLSTIEDALSAWRAHQAKDNTPSHNN